MFLVGAIPTPAVGMLTRSMRADLGIMISASHNHFEDNGIKFFGPDGFKLSDNVEKDIEKTLAKKIDLVEPSLVGRVKRIDEVLGRYTEAVKKSLPKALNLRDLTIVIDCANGSGYKCAPQILWELGAKVIPIGVEPNGYNINLNCGSTNTLTASELVKKHNADLAICLDGDADRVIILDELGNEIDPREELVKHLLEYKKYKSVIEQLSHLEDTRLQKENRGNLAAEIKNCLLYTSPSPRDRTRSRMPSSA